MFKDEMTGAHVKRPGLTRCLKTLKTGDTLIVLKLARLGRNLRDFCRGSTDPEMAVRRSRYSLCFSCSSAKVWLKGR